MKSNERLQITLYKVEYYSEVVGLQCDSQTVRVR